MIKEKEDGKAEEEKMRRRLGMMGVCVERYAWIKQAGEHRCAPGGPFITDTQLGI